tara:strand:- start:299 stop:886 length:588 start_codon:yes stop_codon:yes gene_type:complete
MKRLFDVISSIIVLCIGLPFFTLIAITIAVDSKGGVFFKQQRIGRYKRTFNLYKFRTMKTGAEKSGQLTIGGKDNRITRIGYMLRKYKIDEFPQLINVIKGDMSIVGPRPEVPKYVCLYTQQQLNVLKVRPGLTDYASLMYFKEDELLGKAENPEKTYIEKIMPDKLALNMDYINDKKPLKDFIIILKTLRKIIN